MGRGRKVSMLLTRPSSLALFAACISLAACTAPPPREGDLALAEFRVGTGRLEATLVSSEFGSEVSRAVTSHPDMAAGAARVRAAQGDLQAARAGSLPRLSLGLDLQAGLAGVATGTRYLPVVQVSQLLFDGGRTRARVQSARAGVVGEALARESAAAQLTLSAVESWYEVLHQRRLLALARNNRDEHQRFVEQIEDRLEAGAAAESDFLTARSRLADAVARLATTRGNLDRAEASYMEIFGELPNGLAAAPTAPHLPAGTDAELIATSPRLRGLDAEIEAATAALEAARAAGWPSIDLTVRGEHDPDTGDTSAEATSGPRYDVFDGGQRASNVARAEARLDELEAEKLSLERQIARTLAFLRSDARAGQERLRAARDAVAANEASVVALLDQFSVGRVGILQLLDAQRDLFQAQETLAAAQRDLALSGYAALALTGDILDAFGIVLPTARAGEPEAPLLDQATLAPDGEAE